MLNDIIYPKLWIEPTKKRKNRYRRYYTKNISSPYAAITPFVSFSFVCIHFLFSSVMYTNHTNTPLYTYIRMYIMVCNLQQLRSSRYPLALVTLTTASVFITLKFKKSEKLTFLYDCACRWKHHRSAKFGDRIYRSETNFFAFVSFFSKLRT